MHVLKLFEEYVSGTEQKVGIVSPQTRQLLADVSKLLSPIHSKYRQICLYDEWEHFKMEKDIDCPNVMKDYHVRNFINSYNSISIEFLTHIIWTIYNIFINLSDGRSIAIMHVWLTIIKTKLWNLSSQIATKRVKSIRECAIKYQLHLKILMLY